MDIEAIQQFFTEKMGDMMNEVLQRRTAATKPPVTMKSKGNQIQHDFCQDLLQSLNTAKSFFNSDKKAEGLKSLDLVVKKVEKRDKLIKIADKSEFGWDTVNEYMSDDVASDNEDGKRIKKAEERAEQKKKKRIESYTRAQH